MGCILKREGETPAESFYYSLFRRLEIFVSNIMKPQEIQLSILLPEFDKSLVYDGRCQEILVMITSCHFVKGFVHLNTLAAWSWLPLTEKGLL